MVEKYYVSRGHMWSSPNTQISDDVLIVTHSDYAAMERMYEIRKEEAEAMISEVNALEIALKASGAGYAALEARCREQIALLDRMRADSPMQSLAYYWADICALTASETACEHEWEPVKVTGDNGVISNCKKCGGTKGWNPGAAVETWETGADADEVGGFFDHPYYNALCSCVTCQQARRNQSNRASK